MSQDDGIHICMAECPGDEEMDAPVFFRMYCGELLEQDDLRATPEPLEGTCGECRREYLREEARDKSRRAARARRLAEPAMAA